MKKLLLLPLLFCLSAKAQGLFTDFYIQSNGGATNSGHTLDATPTFARQNGGWDNTTGVFTCIGAGTNDLSGVTNGAWASVYVDAATAAVFIGRVTAVDDTLDTITVSKTFFAGTGPGTLGTTRSIVIGGAWTMPNGTATDWPLNSLRAETQGTEGYPPCVNVKSNLYRVTGNIACASTSRIEGYGQTPHDMLGGPVFDVPAGGSFNVFSSSGGHEFINLVVDGRNFTTGSSANWASSGRAKFWRCVSVGGRLGFSCTSVRAVYFECEAYGSNTDGYQSSAAATYLNCVSHHNKESGWQITGEGNVSVGCIAYYNTTGGWDINNGDPACTFISCLAWGNNNGFASAAQGTAYYNTAAMVNTNLGWSQSGASINLVINNVYATGSFTNFGGTYGGAGALWLEAYASVVLTNQPWIDPTNGNFTLDPYFAAAVGTARGNFRQYTNATETVSYPDLGPTQSSATNTAPPVTTRGFTFGQ